MSEKSKETYKNQLQKSLKHLEYSYQIVQNKPSVVSDMSEDDLASWESLTARFSRVVDIFIGKYLRLEILEQDPGFQGFVRDYLDFGEKLGMIHSAAKWLEYRGVRNRVAHEYLDTQLTDLFRYIFEETPHVLKDLKKHAT